MWGGSFEQLGGVVLRSSAQQRIRWQALWEHSGVRCTVQPAWLPTVGVGVAVGAAVEPDAVAHHFADVQRGLDVPKRHIWVDRLPPRVACGAWKG